MSEENPPNIYAEIDHARFLETIPEMINAFPDRHHFDLEKAKEIADRFIDKHTQTLLDADVPKLLEEVESNPSPENIKKLLDNYAPLYEVSNIAQTAMLMPHYIEPSIDASACLEFSAHVQNAMQPLTAMETSLGISLSSLSDRQKEVLLQDDSLQTHGGILSKLFDDVRKPVDNVLELSTVMQAEAGAAQQHLLDLQNPEFDDNTNAFTQFVAANAACKLASVKASGYEDTFVYSKITNGMGEEELTSIRKGMTSNDAGRDFEKLIDCPNFGALVMEKDFSFDEAKDIAKATINRLHPSLGKEVDAIFSENRAAIKDGGKLIAITMPGNYETDNGKRAAPTFLSDFDGSILSVHLMTHEIAHMVHNKLASEHNDFANSMAPLMQQEHFSHFVELLLKDEMHERATDDQDRAAVDAHFQGGIAMNAMGLQHSASFMREIYKKLESGGDVTNEFVESAYHKSGQEVFGGAWDAKKTAIEDDLFVVSVMGAAQFMPHQTNAYFPNHVAAYALKEKFDENPELIGEQVVEAMKAGATISYGELMDGYFGKGEYEKGSMFTRGMELLSAESQRVNVEVEKLEAELEAKAEASQTPTTEIDSSWDVSRSRVFYEDTEIAKR